MDTVEAARIRLGQLASSRRRSLGLTLSAAARVARIDRATWTGMERGDRRTGEHNFASIERALKWEHGSVDRILAGGDPASLPETPQPRTEGRLSLPSNFNIHFELERIRQLDLPAQAKLDLIRGVMDLYEEAQADLRQQHTN